MVASSSLPPPGTLSGCTRRLPAAAARLRAALRGSDAQRPDRAYRARRGPAAGQPFPKAKHASGYRRRAALSAILSSDELEQAEKKARAGTFTLADLDALSETRSGILSVIFSASYPQDVALKFLSGTDYDTQIQEGGYPGPRTELRFFVRIRPCGAGVMHRIPGHASRHLLMTEFGRTLSEPLPPELSSVSVAEGEEAEACGDVVHVWRNRRDLRDSYAQHADRVEREMGLDRMGFGLEQVRGCHTFAAVESDLQSAVENYALEASSWNDAEFEDLMCLIEERLDGFWSSWPERYPDVQPRWRLVQAAIEVIHAADQIQQGLKNTAYGPVDILQRYIGEPGVEPAWCDIDTHHRRFEVRGFNYYAPGGRDESLDKLVNRTRQRYVGAASQLSERFLAALQKEKFELPGLRRQLATFSKHVEPHVKSGKKTAYVLVDSLRYEMARELFRELQGDHEADLAVAVGTVPTITEIGMAALMPGAESGARVVSVSRGTGLEVGRTVLSDRKSRIDLLKKWSDERSVKMYETKVNNVFTASRKSKVAASIRDADLVLVTSQEIDEQGESGGGPTARLFMDEVLRRIPRAITALVDLGCERIVLASDHGYIFADELDSDTKIDPPGGKTQDPPP